MEADRKLGPLAPEIGDYVLATKWSDGDPGDPWAIGFYAGLVGDTGNRRHMVLDGAGKNIRPNGYRRVGRLTVEMGDWLMKHAALLESAPGKIDLWSMYDWESVNDSVEGEHVVTPAAVLIALKEIAAASIGASTEDAARTPSEKGGR